MMSCHIPLEELRRLQKRATETGETLVTPPADESGEAGAVIDMAAPTVRRRRNRRPTPPARAGTPTTPA